MSLLRPSLFRPHVLHSLPLSQQVTRLSISRTYATGRRQVTVINDDGRVKWSDLNTREKAARTTQQSLNFALVVVGVVMTVGFYLDNLTRQLANFPFSC
jgi:hypothetical protein